MRENNVCQLFISYSHKDINKVERFMTHISPLEKRGEVEIWIDQDNTPGSELQHNIKSKLYSSDIICLFISADYLASPSCNEEKEIALKLRKEKGVSIIPIILSPCNWLDDFDLSSLLAIPFDGKPVSSYVDANNAWTEIIQSIKTVMKEIKYLRDLEISQEFTEFLSTTEMLASAHSRKREITLEDIFIYPELSKYENLDLIEITNLESVIESFTKNSKIVIAGDNQSGKTALCKKCFIELRKKNFLPVFLTDPSGNFHGILQNRIIEALQSEYINFDISQINNSNIVPIIDDFQFAKNKLKLIKELSDYPSAIIIVDDIYSLNIAEEDILSTFTKYRINEFSPFLRNQLIRKWTQLNDRTDNQTENGIYQKIDEKTELVDSALGKVFGSGVMPAYPFFIISIISTYDI
ncbi:MAG: toll/interleukin-1 receptor domain-containing protein, partial [Tissierellales bacterium]|nr:toll/interleukin-1 receptor domain-containing protein [Tissierellales bacterium]